MNEVIPHFDDSPPESSGDESDEDYSPPDAAEDSDSENESQQQPLQWHTCGGKEGCAEARVEPKNAGRGEC